MNEYGNFIRRADLIKNLIEREKLAEETKKPSRATKDANQKRWEQHQNNLRQELSAAIAASVAVGGNVPPSLLFANAERGVWFDASDITTLFQDPAGTIPVTATGQPVGKWLDKSGNNNHATQNTSGSRPTYQVDQYGYPYLDFDGVNDFMITPSINFTTTDKLQASVGLLTHNSASAGTAGIAIELGTDVNAVNGSFYISAPSNTADHGFALRGTTTIAARVNNIVSGDDVLTGLFDISQSAKEAELIARLARQTAASASISWTGTSAGTGNFGNLPLYIGARAGTLFLFKGHMYQIVVRGAESTAVQLVQIENWINSKLQ